MAHIYSASNDNTVRKIDPTGEQVWSFTGHTNYVYAVAVDADGYVYSGSHDTTVRKIDPTGEQVWSFTGHTNAVYAVAVDADGYVYSGSYDNTVRKISPTGQQVWSYTGHTNLISAVAVDADGYVYSGSNDQTAHKISPTGQQVWSYTGHTNAVYAVAVDADGYVYSGSANKTVHKIDPTGEQVWSYTGHTDYVRAVAVDPGLYGAGFWDTGEDLIQGLLEPLNLTTLWNYNQSKFRSSTTVLHLEELHSRSKTQYRNLAESLNIYLKENTSKHLTRVMKHRTKIKSFVTFIRNRIWGIYDFSKVLFSRGSIKGLAVAIRATLQTTLNMVNLTGKLIVLKKATRIKSLVVFTRKSLYSFVSRLFLFEYKHKQEQKFRYQQELNAIQPNLTLSNFKVRLLRSRNKFVMKKTALLGFLCSIFEKLTHKELSHSKLKQWVMRLYGTFKFPTLVGKTIKKSLKGRVKK